MLLAANVGSPYIGLSDARMSNVSFYASAWSAACARMSKGASDEWSTSVLLVEGEPSGRSQSAACVASARGCAWEAFCSTRLAAFALVPRGFCAVPPHSEQRKPVCSRPPQLLPSTDCCCSMVTSVKLGRGGAMRLALAVATALLLANAGQCRRARARARACASGSQPCGVCIRARARTVPAPNPQT